MHSERADGLILTRERWTGAQMTTANAAKLLDGYLLIGAERRREASDDSYTHVSQTTGRPQASVPLAGAPEMHEAVQRARDALPAWRATPPEEKRAVLLRLAALIERDAVELTTMAALESGIPAQLGGGVSLANSYIHYYAGWADKVHGEVIRTPPGPVLDYTIPDPYGVIAVIVPWNFPLGTIGTKIPPAIVSGNTVVLKPPELSPFVALRFGELCLEAGIPPGVVNVVPGGPNGGDALVRHPGVDKISFTGSGPTATRIMQACAERLTPLHLELGGKSANIIFDDADLDAAITRSAFLGACMMAGQGCVLPTRLLAHRAVYDHVVARVGAYAERVVVGDPLESATMMGPVINAASCERILSVIERAQSAGEGKLVAGGNRIGGELADGYFIQPTVFAEVDPASPLAQEEIFGPVLSVMPFDTEDEAIEIANATRYGLGAYVHTRDLSRAHRMAAALDAGVVGINGFGAISPHTPFGGNRASGFGREGGRAGLEEFIRPKNVHVQL
jgi:aldehyde dehydrogenase (NAD+)